MTACSSAPTPNTFKDALDFAGALSKQRLGDTVSKELQKRVGDYSTNIDVKIYLTSSLEHLTKLRGELVQNSETYGSYNSLKSKSAECLADNVSEFFPKLYCTLCYLAFNVNADAYGAGHWQHQECGGSNGLSTWLTSGNEIPSVSTGNSSATIWSGGDLKCPNTSELSNQLEKCVDSGDDKFSMLLSGILFLKPSLTALTSTFLVFVREICVIVCGDDLGEWQEKASRKILHEGFKNQYESLDCTHLMQCCKFVKTNIETLIGKNFSDGALHIPQNSRMMYLKLQSDKFPNYLQWLSQHLPSLTAHLQKMNTDCNSWQPSEMPNGQAAGPFPYGFGFADIGSWNSLSETVKSSLQKLTDANTNNGLPALKRHFENLIGSSTSSSVASAVGGILGTAAVGGAGTAVALNVGGVTTALKGAIGILK